MNKLMILTAFLLVAGLLPTACTEDSRAVGLEAERQYVDLLYALQAGDTTSSRRAARVLDGSVRELRQSAYFPLSNEAFDNFQYHLTQAECAYGDARASIEEGNLDRALVQLDRAVFELAAGDPAGLQDYYVGSIYDFVAAWMEVDYSLRQPDVSFTVAELRSCGKDIYGSWRSVRGRQPSTFDYFGDSAEEKAFAGYHANLDNAVGAFRDRLREGDAELIRQQANVVSEALWDLLLLFATPTDPLPGLAQ